MFKSKKHQYYERTKSLSWSMAESWSKSKSGQWPSRCWSRSYSGGPLSMCCSLPGPVPGWFSRYSFSGRKSQSMSKSS